MTDLNREELIEKTAKAILDSLGIEPAEDGTYWGAGTWPNAVKDARTCWAIFEQAHTPTSDEQDELEVQDLATIIGNVVIDYEDTGPHSQRPITIRDACADWPMEIAGEVQAAGFRRTVQGEPTDDEREVRRAAEERYPTIRPYDHEPTYPKSALRHYMQGAFISGWKASRDRR